MLYNASKILLSLFSETYKAVYVFKKFCLMWSVCEYVCAFLLLVFISEVTYSF